MPSTFLAMPLTGPKLSADWKRALIRLRIVFQIRSYTFSSEFCLFILSRSKK